MYKILDNDLIITYIDETPEIRSLLLDADESIDLLDISEIGDGNLNFVYTIRSPRRSVILKQAVPYLRVVGEDYPLSRVRMSFEIWALEAEKALVPKHVPEIYYRSHDMSLVVMQNLDRHKILRGEMINRIAFPHLAEHISTFLADTLYYTSDFYLDPATKKENVKKFINIELCKITEDFIFTHPYEDNETNAYNPALDMAHVKAFRENGAVKVAVQEMKYKFMTEAQALLHGDLHSGSIMLNQEETYVIDPEFAFYGPMGFDVGIYLANLIMSWYSLDGEDPDYAAYVEGQIADTWNLFAKKFKANMLNHEKEQRSLQFDYPDGLQHFEVFVDRFIAQLFADTVGFAACEMFRRTVGLAKVADVAGIEDLHKRARIEVRILDAASELITSRETLESIEEVLSLIQSKSRS